MRGPQKGGAGTAASRASSARRSLSSSASTGRSGAAQAARPSLRVPLCGFASGLGAGLGGVGGKGFARDLVHEGEPVERVARIGDRARAIGRGAILLDIAPCQRRAAQQHRRRDPLARHLGQVLAHDRRRLDQQARHADRVGVALLRGIEDVLQRLLDAEIDDLVAVVGEDDVDEVLADVVHVALHRGEDDEAALRPVDLFHVGLEKGRRRLHHLGRAQHEGELHLAGAEEIADHLHAVEQENVDDVERLVAFERQQQIVLEAGAVAVDDALRQPLLDRLGALRLRVLRRGAVLEEGDEGFERIVAGPAPVEDQVLGDLDLGVGDLVQRHDLRDMQDRAGHAAPHAHGRDRPS